MIRFLQFYSLLILSTFYYYGLGLMMFLFKPTDEVTHWTASSWGKFNLKQAGVKLHIIGEENLSKTPAIFVVNHQSMLDLFIMCYLLPFKSLAVAKKSMRYYPLLGFFMNLAGVVFVDRRHKERAIEGMREAKRIVERGYSLAIAPEGTRTITGELQPLKKGAFHLAIQTKLPMVPITIKNAYSLFPRNHWIPKEGTVDIFIDAPVKTSNWTIETIPQAIAQIRSIFLSHLEK